jgi:hypothetical protein
MLGKVCDRWIVGESRERVVKMVRMMLVANEQDRMESLRWLHGFGKDLGHRVNIFRYPMHLTWPEEMIETDTGFILRFPQMKPSVRCGKSGESVGKCIDVTFESLEYGTYVERGDPRVFERRRGPMAQFCATHQAC